MKKLLMSAASWLLIFTFVLTAMPHIPAQAAFEEIDFSGFVSDAHPRLYVTSFDGLKEKYLSDPLTAKWYNDLLAEASAISDGGVMCDADGNKLYDIDKLNEQLQGGKYRRIISSQDVLARFYVLAFAAACEDSEALADRLWLEVEDAINLPYWNTRHWLEPAEMMHSISIAYDWCYKFWSDEQREFMETKVYELGIGEAVREYNGYPRWNRWHKGFSGDEIGTNWTVVCNTGVLLTSLAFYDTNPTFYNTKMNNAIRSMKAGLNAWSADGAYRENQNYWNYATRNLIMATDAFECAIGGDFDALPSIEAPFHYDFSLAPGISVTPDFPIYGNGPTGVFNYGDASGGSRTTSPAIMWIGERFDRPDYIKYHVDTISQKGHSGIGIPLDLLWYSNKGEEKQIPNDKLFADKFVSLRSSWDDNALWVAMKGGPNGRPHNHYDIGTFALDYGGIRFFRQLGAIGYDWEGSRHEFYKGRAEGQNTIVVNPDEKSGQAHSGVATFESYYSDDASAYAILDMTDVYNQETTVTDQKDENGDTITYTDPTAVTSARRGIRMYNDRTRVVLQDEVKMSSPSEFWWFAHPNSSIKKSNITVYNNGRSARLDYNGRYLYMNITSNQNAVFEVVDAVPLPSSPDPDDNAINATVKLAVHLKDVTDVNLAIEMIPSDDEAPVFSGYIIPLDQWKPEKDIILSDRNVSIYGHGRIGTTMTMLIKSPLGYVYAIDQTVTDSKGDYSFHATLPKYCENGNYTVYVNGELHGALSVTDGTDYGLPPAAYTVDYKLPDGISSSVLVAAEYNNGCMVQVAKGDYNTETRSATVVFGHSPARGNTVKFFYLADFGTLTPLYPAKTITVE